jgi:NADH-quinone oxidoreductase subunit A
MNFVNEVWPLGVYFIAVVLIMGIILALSYVLGERHKQPNTDIPYESGAPLIGSARQRLNAKFYLVAMIFVIFDLEAVFVIAWALAARPLGWAGYIEILVFIGVLLAALVYLWRMGALDWGSRAKFKNRAYPLENKKKIR